MELADMQDLGSCAERCGGSSPFSRTTPGIHSDINVAVVVLGVFSCNYKGCLAQYVSQWGGK